MLGANTSYSCFVTLDKPCSDSVFPVVQTPACCHSLLAESCVHIHNLAHSKFCESFKFLHLGFRRLLNLRIVNKSVQQFSSAFVAVEVYSAGSSSSVPDIATSATITLRTPICEPSPPRMLCLGKHVQCRGFGCSVGRCRRPELSFWSRRRQNSRCGHNRNIRTHHSLRLTSGIGLSLSLIIHMLRNSTRSLCW